MEPAAIRNQTALLLPAAVLKIRVQIQTAARKIRAQIRTAARRTTVRIRTAARRITARIRTTARRITARMRTAARRTTVQIRTAAQEAAIRTPEQVLIAAITKRYSADKKHWQSAGSDREWQGCMIRKGPHPVPAHIKDGGK